MRKYNKGFTHLRRAVNSSHEKLYWYAGRNDPRSIVVLLIQCASSSVPFYTICCKLSAIPSIVPL